MGVSIKQYQELKNKVDRLQTAADKAKGALQEQMAALEELGYGSVEEAKVALEELAEQEAAAEDEYNTALSDFTEEWGDVLDALPEDD